MKVPVASTSAIADVLALKGRDGWLTPPLLPVVAARCPVVGEAVTVRLERRDPASTAGLVPDFSPMYSVLSGDHAGKVLVIAGAEPIGGAVWGEILSVAARQAGFAGVVIDGYVRDLGALHDLALPVYATAVAVVGPQGRAHVAEVNGTVTISGVEVSSGDTIILDDSGCVRLEPNESADILTAAALYESAEEDVLAALADGERLNSAYKHKSSAVARLRNS